MVGILVVVGVVVVLALGFYFTRGTGGPPPLSAEGRSIDAELSAGPLGEPMPWAEEASDQQEPSPEYIAQAPTPPEDAWAREEARYRARDLQERPGASDEGDRRTR
jgi:hypothetical protein